MTLVTPQYTSQVSPGPLRTTRDTLSGLVVVGSYRTFGSLMGIVCLITCVVIRKTIRSTSITSVNGTTLMSDMASSSSPWITCPAIVPQLHSGETPALEEPEPGAII